MFSNTCFFQFNLSFYIFTFDMFRSIIQLLCVQFNLWYYLQQLFSMLIYYLHNFVFIIHVCTYVCLFNCWGASCCTVRSLIVFATMCFNVNLLSTYMFTVHVCTFEMFLLNCFNFCIFRYCTSIDTHVF